MKSNPEFSPEDKQKLEITSQLVATMILSLRRMQQMEKDNGIERDLTCGLSFEQLNEIYAYPAAFIVGALTASEDAKGSVEPLGKAGKIVNEWYKLRIAIDEKNENKKSGDGENSFAE